MEYKIFVLNSTQELLILFAISDFRFLHCILSFLSHEAIDASLNVSLWDMTFFFLFHFHKFNIQGEQETHRCQVERNHSNLTYPHVFSLHSQNHPMSSCLNSPASLKNSHNPQISIFQNSSPRKSLETSWLLAILGPE